METYTIHELKDIARSLDFELDMLEQGNFAHISSSNVTETDFLLDRLRTLIQQIENTKLESKFK